MRAKHPAKGLALSRCSTNVNHSHCHLHVNCPEPSHFRGLLDARPAGSPRSSLQHLPPPVGLLSGLVTGSTFQAEPWRGPTVQPVLHTLDVIGHQALSNSADKTL